MGSKFLCLDFDGTCVTHEYPQIGQDIGAAPVIRDLIAAGWNIILWTMRSGPQLEEAVAWCIDNKIELYAVNHNPTQSSWTSSPKAYAQIYIDDAALGAPLIRPKSSTERPYIDWNQVRNLML